MTNQSTYYIPRLYTRMGEMRALKALTNSERDTSRLVPLFEVPPIPWDYESGTPREPYHEHAVKSALSIANNWDKESKALVDAIDVPTEETDDEKTVVYDLFSDPHLEEFQLIPVLHDLDTSSDAFHQVKKILAKQEDSSACLRASVDVWSDLTVGSNLLDWMAALGITKDKCYVLLDLGSEVGKTSYIALRQILPMLERLSPQSHFAVLATSVPDRIEKLIDEAPRTEWIEWTNLANSLRTQDYSVSFGDYGTVGNAGIPSIDPRLMFISGKFKYTTSDSWVFGRGALFKGNKKNPGIGGRAIKSVLSSVQGHHSFVQGHCETDDWIDDIVSGSSESFGNPTSWIQHSMFHHLIKVLEQIVPF